MKRSIVVVIAAGRYRHAVDQHNAPLDPNFTGCGRTLTDAVCRGWTIIAAGCRSPS
jgi:protocatechuate 3,4-dioxygenase beta subunit